MEDLIGPDLLCWNSIFWIKEAGSASYVGWHQDYEYWGLDDDRLVSVWIALSPASVAAGCMSVIPGSHRRSIGHSDTYADDNLLSRGQELETVPSEHDPISMPLSPGQVSFHNVRSAHGSGPNTTDDRRIGQSMHFMPTSTRQIKVDWDSAALVRGIDNHGNFSHCPRPKIDMDPDTLFVLPESRRSNVREPLRRHADHEAVDLRSARCRCAKRQEIPVKRSRRRPDHRVQGGEPNG